MLFYSDLSAIVGYLPDEIDDDGMGEEDEYEDEYDDDDDTSSVASTETAAEAAIIEEEEGAGVAAAEEVTTTTMNKKKKRRFRRKKKSKAEKSGSKALQKMASTGVALGFGLITGVSTSPDGKIAQANAIQGSLCVLILFFIRIIFFFRSGWVRDGDSY